MPPLQMLTGRRRVSVSVMAMALSLMTLIGGSVAVQGTANPALVAAPAATSNVTTQGADAPDGVVNGSSAWSAEDELAYAKQMAIQTRVHNVDSTSVAGENGNESCTDARLVIGPDGQEYTCPALAAAHACDHPTAGAFIALEACKESCGNCRPLCPKAADQAALTALAAGNNNTDDDDDDAAGALGLGLAALAAGASKITAKGKNQWCNNDKKPVMPSANADLAACTASCRSNPLCAWVGFRQSYIFGMRVNYCEFWGVGSCQNPHLQNGHDIYEISGSCEASFQEMGGSDVEATTYSGTTDLQKDDSCCRKCSANPSCEFWVRATNTWSCWLKRAFTNHLASGTRRGAFRSFGASAGAGAPSDAFKVIFVSDLERGYRGHTDRDIEDVMNTIIAQKPALVIHGGDNYDKKWTRDKALKYYAKLLDNDIPFITTNGNHDTDDFASHVFVEESYARTAELAKTGKFTFSYEQPADAAGYKAEFNGLQIASFLWKGQSPGTNSLPVPLTRARADAMKKELTLTKPTLVVNHHPQMAEVDTLVQALPVGSAVFCGHTHDSKIRPIGVASSILRIGATSFQKGAEGKGAGYAEYTAPYPHQWENIGDGVARDIKENGMLSVLVSPTYGVYSVTQIDIKSSRTWSDGTMCSHTVASPPTDTCFKCKNGWDWWGSKLGHYCGPSLEYGREWNPKEMKDQACPAHYRDDGVLCTRCYWRGWLLKCNTIGSLGCDAGLEQVGFLCYKRCRAGYHGSGLWCTKR